MLDEMEEEYFCLKWSDHHINMLSNFGSLLRNEALCDVTIACDGLSIKAHKLILSASSPFFHKLFLDNPSTNPILILSDLKHADLKTLIDFMYHGRVNVSENQLAAILKAAENLKIRGLGDCMEQLFNLDEQAAAFKAKFLNKNANKILTNSEACNVNNFKEKAERIHRDHSYVEESISYDQQSESNSMDTDKLHASNNDTNQVDMAVTFDSHLDINPSKLMEQSMTTEEVCTKKLFLENSPENKSFQYDSDNNADYDSIHIKLPANVHLSELESSNIYLDQNYSTTEGTNLHAKNQDLKISCSNADQSFGSSHESLGSLKLSDSLSLSPVQGSSLQFAAYESLSESSKRGRKPGSRLCVLCKHVFHSENELERHMDDHKSTTSCEDTDSRKLPELVEFSDSQPVTDKSLLKLPLVCSTCKYVMSTLSDAQSHLSSNPNCRTSQFKCLLCPKLFIWPATLMKHFREQHEGPGGITRVTRRMWYFCDVCKKPLLSKHALSLHRSKFHGITQPVTSGSEESLDNCKRGRKRGTRVCGICKRTFLGSDYFTHVQTVHKNISLSDSSVEAPTYMSESISIDNESNSSQSAT